MMHISTDAIAVLRVAFIFICTSARNSRLHDDEKAGLAI